LKIIILVIIGYILNNFWVPQKVLDSTSLFIPDALANAVLLSPISVGNPWLCHSSHPHEKEGGPKKNEKKKKKKKHLPSLPRPVLPHPSPPAGPHLL
jgi:hypothetical protein